MITAGFPRQPGMSRMDLLGQERRDHAQRGRRRWLPVRPNAILIVVSNPLDEMTVPGGRSVSGFPKERVIGMAGVLDSARLRYFIAEELGVSPLVVEAMTLGSHGDAMVALPRHATVDGRPLPELVDEATLERLFQRTRDGGAEIVALLKKGRAYYAPERLGRGDGRGDRRATRTRCCRSAPGRPAQYGIADVYVGVPARLGPAGVEEIVELD